MGGTRSQVRLTSPSSSLSPSKFQLEDNLARVVCVIIRARIQPCVRACVCIASGWARRVRSLALVSCALRRRRTVATSAARSLACACVCVRGVRLAWCVRECAPEVALRGQQRCVDRARGSAAMSDDRSEDDPIMDLWYSNWEQQCVEALESEPDYESQLHNEKELYSQQMWTKFQTTASAIAQLYKGDHPRSDRGAPITRTARDSFMPRLPPSPVRATAIPPRSLPRNANSASCVLA